jgi:hypothetical protein
MLKYSKKFASIKNKLTFVTFLIQQQYKSITIKIQKKLFIYICY